MTGHKMRGDKPIKEQKIWDKRLNVLVGLQRPLLVRKSEKTLQRQFDVQFMQTSSTLMVGRRDVEGLGPRCGAEDAGSLTSMLLEGREVPSMVRLGGRQTDGRTEGKDPEPRSKNPAVILHRLVDCRRFYFNSLLGRIPTSV